MTLRILLFPVSAVLFFFFFFFFFFFAGYASRIDGSARRSLAVRRQTPGVTSPVDFDWSGMFDFVRRQYHITRHYAFRWWLLALIAATVGNLAWMVSWGCLCGAPSASLRRHGCRRRGSPRFMPWDCIGAGPCRAWRAFTRRKAGPTPRREAMAYLGQPDRGLRAMARADRLGLRQARSVEIDRIRARRQWPCCIPAYPCQIKERSIASLTPPISSPCYHERSSLGHPPTRRIEGLCRRLRRGHVPRTGRAAGRYRPLVLPPRPPARRPALCLPGGRLRQAGTQRALLRSIGRPAAPISTSSTPR